MINQIDCELCEYGALTQLDNEQIVSVMLGAAIPANVSATERVVLETGFCATCVERHGINLDFAL
jgi:hypothetical protein